MLSIMKKGQLNTSRIVKINAMLFIIIIFLSLIAWFQPGLHKAVSQYLTALKAENVNTIIIERQDIGSLKLKKHANGWFIEEPYYLPANPLRVDTITSLAEKRSFSKFNIDEQELTRYHLKNPPVSVWLNENKIIIGNENPINQQRYAMNLNDNIRSGNNSVHLINGIIYYQLRANLDTFIAPSLLPPQSKINSIEWSGKKLTIAGARWTLSPDSLDISSDSIAQLINFWQHAQASKVETNVSLAINETELQQGQSITISFSSDAVSHSIQYLIVKEGRQIKLLRTDVNVAYWISPQIFKQLTEFISQKVP